MQIRNALVVSVAVGWAVQALAASPQILVLSNRADLISGGDALVEIKWPDRTNVALAKIALDGVNVKAAFAMRSNGRYMGLLSGLKLGPNMLTARIPGGGAQIRITNHAIGGPIFAGAQLQPWICARRVATPVTVVGNPGSTPATATANTRVSGLADDPSNDQCDTPPTYSYYYQSVSAPPTCTFAVGGGNSCFTQYQPGARPPDAEIANFTNDRGVTVKSLLRVERGSLNRTIYTLVSFYDPLDAITPWSPPKGWNGKLVWQFGASSGVSRFESSPGRSLYDSAGGVGLQRGFMVATSSLTDHGTNSNDTLAAETMMMVKERITETYGPIRYTIGDGCSGGSIMQQAIASAYPGLLDGIQPQCSYPDTQTTFIEIGDCGVLQAHYYTKPDGALLTPAQRAAINGHNNTGFCAAWIAAFLPAADPTRAANCGAGFPAALVYHKTNNPKGIRCAGSDHAVAALGSSVDADGIERANSAVDNVGIQYGLKALAAGVISAEEFVRLNEGVGGYDGDLVWTPQRKRARPEALTTFYRGGYVSDGRQLAKVPIIDMRGNQSANGDIHMNWRPWSIRDRLDRDHGGHGNQVIWAFNSAGGASSPGAALLRKAFTTMDAWLAAIESDTSAAPIEQKVLNNKPAAAVDFCLATTGSTDAQLAVTLGIDDAACPVKRQTSPRQVAGGPQAENVFKCSLKPMVLTDPAYGGVTFTQDQRTRLAAVFADGVCNWDAPGVSQVAVDPWTTFAAGPGGQPLGAPPVSVAIP